MSIQTQFIVAIKLRVKKGLLVQVFFLTDYDVGCDITLSPLFFYKSFPATDDWSPKFAIYGDMGNSNAQSLPRLQRETEAGLYDMILHVGDYAYNLQDVGPF